jgi:hypothetical protein
MRDTRDACAVCHASALPSPVRDGVAGLELCLEVCAMQASCVACGTETRAPRIVREGLACRWCARRLRAPLAPAFFDDEAYERLLVREHELFPLRLA